MLGVQGEEVTNVLGSAQIAPKGVKVGGGVVIEGVSHLSFAITRTYERHPMRPWGILQLPMCRTPGFQPRFRRDAASLHHRHHHRRRSLVCLSRQPTHH